MTCSHYNAVWNIPANAWFCKTCQAYSLRKKVWATPALDKNLFRKIELGIPE